MERAAQPWPSWKPPGSMVPPDCQGWPARTATEKLAGVSDAHESDECTTRMLCDCGSATYRFWCASQASPAARRSRLVGLDFEALPDRTSVMVCDVPWPVV